MFTLAHALALALAQRMHAYCNKLLTSARAQRIFHFYFVRGEHGKGFDAMTLRRYNATTLRRYNALTLRRFDAMTL